MPFFLTDAKVALLSIACKFFTQNFLLFPSGFTGSVYNGVLFAAHGKALTLPTEYTDMIYPKNFENKIGFDEIKTMIKGRCLSSAGTEIIDRLSFQTCCRQVNTLLQQVREMRRIIDEAEDFPTENFFDMRPALIHLQVKGTYMEETELFSLKASLATTGLIIKFLNHTDDNEKHGAYPALCKLTESVESFPRIVECIDRILNKFGKIKDDASPELKRIRETLSSTKRDISISLHKIMAKAQENGYVEKDASPTFRDGRLVIPVSPGLKRKIRGIVHDESASGKTVFIEPAEVVELGNRVRELEMEEKRAVITVLQSIALEIRPYVNQLLNTYYFLGLIDAIRAKAVFAGTIGGIEPHVTDFPIIDWVQARHPLLEFSLRRHGREIHPLDITIQNDERILLISGPNAGGKSVCLKTAGLLQYMLQCGISIPVKENSKVGIFNSIFIDVGDDQSIEDELSTYSGHLLNMKNMMKGCDGHSLILIDEFGGGTEPQIGAAIAQAMLDRFLQSKTFGIITTHYQNLKDFADNHRGIVNGAMLYDRQLMQPLYQLQIGQPGSSFAIEIARKTGIPDEVIQEASEIVGSEYIQSDKYLQDIVRDRRYWENKRQNIHKKEKRLDELISRYENNMRDLEESRKEVLKTAREKAKTLLNESNAQIEHTIKSIREAQAEKEETKRIRQNLNEYKETVADYEQDRESSVERKMRQIMERKARHEMRKKNADETNAKNQTSGCKKTGSDIKTDASPREGQFAKIKGQSVVVKILRIEGRKAVVTGGTVQLTVPTDRLIPADATKEEEKTEVSFIGRSTREQIYEKKLSFHPEIDIRGMNGEEALNAVTYFIDDALLLGIPRVRILHGTGSGYLRSVVREYLHTVPGITAYHDEHVQFGGSGITVVEFN